MTVRVPRSLPVDLGLVALAAALVVALVFGSASLRPYDAPELDPRPALHIEDLIGKGRKQISMAAVAIESVAPYAAADAEIPLRLMELQIKELKRVGGEKLSDEIDLPLTPVLASMEMEGVLLDLPFLKEMSNELTKRLAEIEKQIFDSVGKTFNVNSTQQLSDVLFITLGLEPPDKSNKSASGHYSTAAGVLEMLSGKHPVVDWVLEHRELSKLKSTYLDALPLAGGLSDTTSSIPAKVDVKWSVHLAKIEWLDLNKPPLPPRCLHGECAIARIADLYYANTQCTSELLEGGIGALGTYIATHKLTGPFREVCRRFDRL